MDHKTAQEIALKRYGFIAPFVSGNIDKYKSKSDFFRDAGSKAGVHPHTVRRWYNRYLKFGFDGLIPKPRNDSNQSVSYTHLTLPTTPYV